MEINFKFKVGDAVRYVMNPEIRLVVVERLYQECYSGCAQIHYKVRPWLERCLGTPSSISRELVLLTEPELVLITSSEMEEIQKIRDRFKI